MIHGYQRQNLACLWQAIAAYFLHLALSQQLRHTHISTDLSKKTGTEFALNRPSFNQAFDLFQRISYDTYSRIDEPTIIERIF
jgi:hypothetical protein